jgi:hypothetical protein
VLEKNTPIFFLSLSAVGLTHKIKIAIIAIPFACPRATCCQTSGMPHFYIQLFRTDVS